MSDPSLGGGTSGRWRELVRRSADPLARRFPDGAAPVGGDPSDVPHPSPEPPDPEAEFIAALEAAHRGDRTAAVTAFLHAAAGWEASGRFDAALDACMCALPLAPATPSVHLRMLAIYRSRGWHALADDRAARLEQLLSLGG